MTVTRRFKAGCLITLLVGFCLGAGFVLGIVAHQAWKKKTEEPAFMRWAAMNHLKKLNPTPEQLPKLEARVDAAVAELVNFKGEAHQTVWNIIDKAVIGISEDLSPEQRVEWEKISPHRPLKGSF